MKRERLQKLFSEDKEIFHGGMLFPTWICKGNGKATTGIGKKADCWQITGWTNLLDYGRMMARTQ